MHTPWGQSQHTKTIAPGIIEVSTASHGGIHVAPGLLAKMPAAFVTRAFGGNGRGGWFEEDCDWCLVAIAFPKHFDARHKLHAWHTARGYHAETLAEAGLTPPPVIAEYDSAVRWCAERGIAGNPGDALPELLSAEASEMISGTAEYFARAVSSVVRDLRKEQVA